MVTRCLISRHTVITHKSIRSCIMSWCIKNALLPWQILSIHVLILMAPAFPLLARARCLWSWWGLLLWLISCTTSQLGIDFNQGDPGTSLRLALHILRCW